MKNCDLAYEDEDTRSFLERKHYWCKTHKLEAKHNGGRDTGPVCSAYAVVNGCRCCAENHEKLERSNELNIYVYLNGKLLDLLAPVSDDDEKVVLEYLKSTLPDRYPKQLFGY